MIFNSHLGLIGAGKWGLNYVKTIQNIDESILKKIACKNLKNKSTLIHKYDVSNNWHDVTSSSDIQGVIIATPPKNHFEIAKEAIKNKKSVIIEKPVTLNSKNAKYLKDLALKNKVSVRVNHVYLYHPMYRFLKYYIAQQNKLNSIISIAGNYGPFRNDVSPLWDWAPHDIAMCLDIMGEFPSTIKAHFSKQEEKDKKNQFNVSINLCFKNNKFAILNVGNIMQSKKRFLRINFENKSFIFDPLNFSSIQEVKGSKMLPINPSAESPSFDFFATPLEILLKEFIKDIKNSSTIISDLILGEKVVQVIELVDEQLISIHSQK